MNIEIERLKFIIKTQQAELNNIHDILYHNETLSDEDVLEAIAEVFNRYTTFEKSIENLIK